MDADRRGKQPEVSDLRRPLDERQRRPRAPARSPTAAAAAAPPAGADLARIDAARADRAARGAPPPTGSRAAQTRSRDGPRCWISTAVTMASSSSGHRSSTNRASCAIVRARSRSGQASATSDGERQRDGQRREREQRRRRGAGATARRAPRRRRSSAAARSARAEARSASSVATAGEPSERLCQESIIAIPQMPPRRARASMQHQPVAPVVLLPFGLPGEPDRARLRRAGRAGHELLELHRRDALHGALTRVDVDGERRGLSGLARDRRYAAPRRPATSATR